MFLALAFTLNAAANVLLKFAAANQFSFSALFRFEFTAAHLYAASAAVLFALNLGFYLLALRSVPLAVGYPIMIGMTFVLTTGAAILLGERITLFQAIGLAMILLGVVVTVRAG